jgi:hypothetical protein
MTTPPKDLYTVPQLTTANFPTWKFKIEFVLKDRGLWKYVEPTTSTSSQSSSTSSSDSQDSTFNLEQKALTQICLTVSEEIIPLVRPCKTAREAWTTICQQFEQKGMSSRVSLKRQLFNSKFDESTSMQSHINLLRSMALQLEIVGAPVSDEDLAVVLLCSLPPRFDAFVVQMDGRPPQDITFNFVSSRLLAEFERQSTQNRDLTQHHPLAMTATSRTSSRKGGEAARDRPRCPWCNRRGHAEDMCWDKEDGKPRFDEKTSSAAALATQFDRHLVF